MVDITKYIKTNKEQINLKSVCNIDIRPKSGILSR